MRISDWSSDVCSSDLSHPLEGEGAKQGKGAPLEGKGAGQGEVLRLRDIAFADAAALLARYDLHLEHVPDDAPIPGSYWGESEAGLIGPTVHARSDTPVQDRKSTRLNSSH